MPAAQTSARSFTLCGFICVSSCRKISSAVPSDSMKTVARRNEVATSRCVHCWKVRTRRSGDHLQPTPQVLCQTECSAYGRARARAGSGRGKLARCNLQSRSASQCIPPVRGAFEQSFIARHRRTCGRSRARAASVLSTVRSSGTPRYGPIPCDARIGAAGLLAPLAGACAIVFVRQGQGDIRAPRAAAMIDRRA